MKAVVCSLLLASACAPHPLPPNNELEMPADQGPGEANTVGESKMPAASRELAKAFDPPAPAPSQVEQSNVPAPVTRPDDMVSVREAFAQELGQAKKLVASGTWADAAPVLEGLEKDAARLGPSELQSVLELTVKGASAAKEWRAVRKAAERWLLACGPERVDGCRAKALGQLSRVGAQQKTAEAAPAKARAAAVRTADECLQRAESAARSKGPVPSCLEGALSTYRSLGDKLMLARGSLAKAQSVAADAKKREHAVELYEHVSGVCDEQRCVSVRRRALKQWGWLELESGDLQKAAKVMLEEMHLSATTMPDDRRRYARTPEVEKVCAALDAREGVGACRKLEKTVVGDYTFKDFSEKKAGVGLRADLVREVNEHYGVMLQDCLAQQAERLKPPAFETYQVEWMVMNDGRVDQVHMARRDQDETPLAQCLRLQFGVWRYPRYDGETQHVEQSFTVSARERR